MLYGYSAKRLKFKLMFQNIVESIKYFFLNFKSNTLHYIYSPEGFNVNRKCGVGIIIALRAQMKSAELFLSQLINTKQISLISYGETKFRCLSILLSLISYGEFNIEMKETSS